MKKSLALPILFLMLFMGAHYAYGWSPVSSQASVRVEGFPGIAYQAADALEYNLTADISRTLPVLFSSFVDISDLNSTSLLGRMLGEQIGSRFSQHGYNVVEIRLRKDSLHISQDEGTGELALSRDMTLIRDSWDAQAVITGTYHIFDDRAVVSARIVSTLDNSIISSHDFSFRLDRYLKTMVEPDRLIKKRKEARELDAEPGPISTGALALSPARSTDAKLIQRRLADLGLYLDRIDGIWGRNSRIALERFKMQHQLPGPDKWDMPTQIKLFQGTYQ